MTINFVDIRINFFLPVSLLKIRSKASERSSKHTHEKPKNLHYETIRNSRPRARDGDLFFFPRNLAPDPTLIRNEKKYIYILGR